MEKLLPARVMLHRPLYWRSWRNSPRDVHHKKITGTHVHARRSKRRVKFGVAGEALSSSETPITAVVVVRASRNDGKRRSERSIATHCVSRWLDCQKAERKQEDDPSLSALVRIDDFDTGLGVAREADAH
jgi:hypothetical protein